MKYAIAQLVAVVWLPIICMAQASQVEGWWISQGAPSQYQLQDSAIAKELREHDEVLSDFYARPSQKPSSTGEVFDLSHKNDFLPKNQLVIGNPSGKRSNDLFR